MKKYSKLLAITFSLLLMAAALSGCGTGEAPEGTSGEISESAAKEKVLEKVPDATMDHIAEFETDYEEDGKEYEGLLVYGKMECEFAIDAQTGDIVDWEVRNYSDCPACN